MASSYSIAKSEHYHDAYIYYYGIVAIAGYLRLRAVGLDVDYTHVRVSNADLFCHYLHECPPAIGLDPPGALHEPPCFPADAIVPVSGLARVAFQRVAIQTCDRPRAATCAVYIIGAA